MSDLTLAPLSSFDIGGACSAAIGIGAWRAGSLSATGALAAFLVGTATCGALGVPGAVVLLTFFVSSVALTRVGKTRKKTLLVDVGKTGPRDGAQVFANGGVAAICALLALFVDHRYAYAFAGAFAAAAADTWGTEIGTLVRGAPRSILTLQPIATGLSGGVTAAGSLAEVAGALAIAAVSLLVRPDAFVPVLCAGIAGALADSLLGASLQALRWCPYCKRATEREPHGCGANTQAMRGFAWFGNDAVNLSATVTGAAVAFLLAR